MFASQMIHETKEYYLSAFASIRVKQRIYMLLNTISSNIYHYILNNFVSHKSKTDMLNSHLIDQKVHYILSVGIFENIRKRTLKIFLLCILLIGAKSEKRSDL